MMNTLFTIMIVVIFVAELIVSGLWIPFYFRTGIPLFRKSFRFSERPMFSADELSHHFQSGILAVLVFHESSPGEIAFRQGFMKFSFFPSHYLVMRGLIQVNEWKHEVSVTGYTNWSPILCVPPLLILVLSPVLSRFFLFAPASSYPLFLLFCILFLIISTIPYAIGIACYNALFKSLEDMTGRHA